MRQPLRQIPCSCISFTGYLASIYIFRSTGRFLNAKWAHDFRWQNNSPSASLEAEGSNSFAIPRPAARDSRKTWTNLAKIDSVAKKTNWIQIASMKVMRQRWTAIIFSAQYSLLLARQTWFFMRTANNCECPVWGPKIFRAEKMELCYCPAPLF